jgi:hypothetical protein
VEPRHDGDGAVVEVADDGDEDGNTWLVAVVAAADHAYDGDAGQGDIPCHP